MEPLEKKKTILIYGTSTEGEDADKANYMDKSDSIE